MATFWLSFCGLFSLCIPGVSLLVRVPVTLVQRPALVTSFNLNYLFKGSVFKYSHTGGLELQHELWEHTSQSTYNRWSRVWPIQQLLVISLANSMLRGITFFFFLKLTLKTATKGFASWCSIVNYLCGSGWWLLPWHFRLWWPMSSLGVLVKYGLDLAGCRCRLWLCTSNQLPGIAHAAGSRATLRVVTACAVR